jgi:hypothetical protein
LGNHSPYETHLKGGPPGGELAADVTRGTVACRRESWR